MVYRTAANSLYSINRMPFVRQTESVDRTVRAAALNTIAANISHALQSLGCRYSKSYDLLRSCYTGYYGWFKVGLRQLHTGPVPVAVRPKE